MSRTRLAGRWLCLLTIIGCGSNPPPVAPTPVRTLSQEESDAAYREMAPGISFLDDVASQSPPTAELQSQTLVDLAGESTTLSDIAPGKHLVVVMVRGFNGGICPYCSTQTARLITKYQEIADLNAEIVLIYPLEAGKENTLATDFLGKVNAINSHPREELPPFPVLLDVGLKVVDLLGIRKDLSKPATYILDPGGAVRFSYVGNTLNDRPSVKAIVQQLQQLQQAGGS